MQIARDQMERLVRLPWDDADVQPTALDGARAGHAQPSRTTRARWCSSSSTSPIAITTAPFNADVRMIDVDVQWNEADADPAAPPRRFVLSTNKNNEDDELTRCGDAPASA